MVSLCSLPGRGLPFEASLLAASRRGLERNVVVHLVERAAFARRGAFARRRRRRAVRRAAGSRAIGSGPAAAAAEQLHAVGDDLGRVALLAFLVLPLARADAAFDVDRRALLQVFARDLGGLAEERDAMPLGVLLLLAALVLPRVGRGDADVGDRVAARQVARFRDPRRGCRSVSLC